MIDRERFTQIQYAYLKPIRLVEKEPVGELSLSSESESLSLRESVLPDLKENRPKVPPNAQALQKGDPFLAMHQCRDVLGRVGERLEDRAHAHTLSFSR